MGVTPAASVLRRATVAVVMVTSAGCSLFLTDGLSSDEPIILVQQADGGQGGGGGDGASASDASIARGPDAAGPSAYAAEVLADQPVAYYPLDDLAGDRVKDASGRGRDGFLVDATQAELGVSGVSTNTGKAIRLKSFDGIQIGDGFDFAGRVPVTVEAWVRPDPQNASLGWRHVFSNLELQNGPVSGNYFYWFDDPGSERIAFERWSGRGSRQTVALERVRFSTARFTHVVAVASGSETYLYVDGQQVAAGLVLGDCAANDVAATFGLNFFGTLDELAIYDRALPVARIKAHHDAGRGTP